MSISASSVTLAAWSRSVKSGAGWPGAGVFGVRTASWEYRFRVDRAMGKAPVIVPRRHTLTPARSPLSWSDCP